MLLNAVNISWHPLQEANKIEPFGVNSAGFTRLSLRFRVWDELDTKVSL